MEGLEMHTEEGAQYDANVLIKDLTYEQYDSIPGIRSSHLSLMKKSMAHYKYEKVKKETEALAFGKLFHEAMERPSTFFEKYVVEPDVKLNTKIGKETYEAFLKTLNYGQVPIEAKQMETLTGMINAAMKHSFVKNLISSGQKESVLHTTCSLTGVAIKCKYDFITADGEPVDFKTTRDAEPSRFAREIFSDDRLYHLQGAHYTNCAREAKVDVNPNVFIDIAFEKTEPYGISVHILDHYALAEGEKWRRHLMEKYVKCLKTDVWPGYEEEAKVVIPPSWIEQPPSDLTGEENFL